MGSIYINILDFIIYPKMSGAMVHTIGGRKDSRVIYFVKPIKSLYYLHTWMVSLLFSCATTSQIIVSLIIGSSGKPPPPPPISTLLWGLPNLYSTLQTYKNSFRFCSKLEI